jgi:tetratricopeptide (TPR) repeat protein
MRISRTLFILAMVSTLTMPFVFAQKTNTKRRTPSQATPSSSPTKGRARLAVKPTASKPEATTESTKTDSTLSEATAQPSKASSPYTSDPPAEAQVNPNEKPADTTPATTAQPASSADPILTLRDQIDAAATPQERIRFQLQLAELFSTSGKRTEAVAELHAVTGLDVFDPPGFYNAGNALARLGNIDEAVNAYRKAIDQRKGKYSRAFNNLGVVLLRVGRWDEAHDAFLGALKVENFRYAEASYNLGRLYVARGQMDLAIREWRRAIVVDPQHKAAAQSLARLSDEGSITMETVAVARETSKRRLPNTTSSIAVVERPAAKPSSARTSTKPLALDFASFSFLQKARSASERGNKLEAVDNYQRLLSRQNGYFAPANLELSFVLISLKRNNEALATLLQVANRDGSRYPISYYHVARLYEGKGELKLAEESFARTIAAYGTDNTQFLLDLSRIREKQGNFKGALEAMEQYIAIVKKDGQDVVWSEERVAALRQKAASPR